MSDDDHDGGSHGIFVNLTVPPDVEAGVDSLTFEYEGNELDILIPPGSVAGDVLRIQVGVQGGDDGDGDGDGDSDDERGDTKSGGDKEEERGSKARSSLMDELGGVSDGEDEKRASNNGDGKAPGDSNKEDGNNPTKPQEKLTSRNIARSDDGITVVELGRGCPHIAPLPATSLRLLESLPINPTASATAKISNNEASVGDGTHGMVWASGTLLAQALTSSFGVNYLIGSLGIHTIELHGSDEFHINCLELGSGLGACGLALAHAIAAGLRTHGSHSEVEANILLTDMGGKAAALLGENVARNIPESFHDGSLNGGALVNVAAAPWVWGGDLPETTNPHADEGFHLILGSDLLYTHASYDPLVATLKKHLHPDGTILLAVRWRKPDLERDFFRRAAEEAGLTFELWDEFLADADYGGRRSPCKLGWREYGNPECEASNRYFHETNVSVGEARTVSLADVSEKDMESMNDEEYATFEELQVQVYLGRYDGGNDADPPPKRKRQREDS